MNAGTGFVNLIDDIATKETIEGLKESRQSINGITRSIPSVIEAMEGFYESVQELPRVQANVNTARKKLLTTLEDLILKLKSSLNLADEFLITTETKIENLSV